MAEPDFLDRLQASRDTVRKFQQSLMRMAMPVEQRKALLDGLARIVTPGEQLQAIVDMIDSFGPPLAQVEALRDELAEQRAQVEAMGARLEHMQAAAERLALAAEQIIAFQGPFVHMAEMVTGQRADRPRGAHADSAEDADEDD
jgi:hypothetical protein